MHHCARIFGANRADGMIDELRKMEHEDLVTQAEHFCLSALDTSGFYDDPSDNKRTIANLTTTCLAYLSKWKWDAPIWVELNESKPAETRLIGVELPFEMVISYTMLDGSIRNYKFCGKLDGFQKRKRGWCIEENKTTSRATESFIECFDMASQITGYFIAGRLALQQDGTDETVVAALLHLAPIPLPKSYSAVNNIGTYPVMREDHHFEQWLDDFLYTATMYEEYKDNPFDAPKFTHSCSRYFTTCMFFYICIADKETQRDIVENQMETKEWSPLHPED